MRAINYQTYKKPSDYAKLSDGPNRVKILRDGVICYEHSMMLGRKFIPLCICTEEATCEQCLKGNLPKIKYKWIVYFINTKETQLLSVGPEIGDQICQIGKTAENSVFEVNIHRRFEAGRFRSTVTRVEPNNMDLETLKEVKKRTDYLAVKYLNI